MGFGTANNQFKCFIDRGFKVWQGQLTQVMQAGGWGWTTPRKDQSLAEPTMHTEPQGR